MRDFKIHGILKQEVGLKGIKRPRWTKIKQEAEVIKTRPFSLPNRTIRFSQNRWSLSRVWDFIWLGKIWSYPTRRATSCCLYKCRSRPIVRYHQHNQSNYYFSYFFLQLDLLAAATTSKVVMVHASPPYRRRLAGGGAPRRSPAAPLTTVGPDKTKPSSFCNFWAGASGLCSFRVTTMPKLSFSLYFCFSFYL
jgi:hypothetical protein